MAHEEDPSQPTNAPTARTTTRTAARRPVATRCAFARHHQAPLARRRQQDHPAGTGRRIRRLRRAYPPGRSQRAEEDEGAVRRVTLANTGSMRRPGQPGRLLFWRPHARSKMRISRARQARDDGADTTVEPAMNFQIQALPPSPFAALFDCLQPNSLRALSARSSPMTARTIRAGSACRTRPQANAYCCCLTSITPSTRRIAPRVRSTSVPPHDRHFPL